MKLTKENVYVNLQGKTKEELTDLWEFLTSNGEECYRDLELFLEYTEEKCYFGYDLENFCDIGGYNAKNKTAITIEHLKEIIRPMDNKGEQLRAEAKRRGYDRGNFKCLLGSNRDVHENIEKWHYERSQDILYTMPDCEGGSVVYKDGVWAEIVSEYLEQQLEKAEAEVKRLKSLIEEESKPKVKDWVYNKEEDIIYQKSYNTYNQYEKKITNPELIKLLEQEIK